MPFQAYQANAIFGANNTGPIVILANTIQEVAETALRAMDQNTVVLLANGETRGAAVRNAAVVGTIASNSRSGFVLVRDPSLGPFQSPLGLGANAYNVAVTTTPYTNDTRPITARDGTVTVGSGYVSQTFG